MAGSMPTRSPLFMTGTDRIVPDAPSITVENAN